MDMTDPLRSLGVSNDTLTAAERTSLARDGYFIVPGLLPATQAADLAARLDAIAQAEGENAGKDFQQEKGATRLGTLINKDPAFDVCFLHPKGLAGVNELLPGDFGLSSITGRAAQPGEGHQALHRDNQTWDSANVLWAISEFTADNGPTRLVPGSHLGPQAPPEGMVDPAAPHPDEIYAVVPAGTLIVINGRTWHGGTRNRTNKPRHLVSAFFLPRGKYQAEAHRELSAAAHARLSPAARQVIDFTAPSQ